MDIPTSTSPAANYNEIQVGSKTVQVPWKSVETNKIDRIVAHIAGDPADTVRFLTKEGNLVLSAPGDKAFVSQSVQNTPSSGSFKQLLVTGREKEDHLKAWYPEYEQVNDTTKKQTRILAGQVNIAAYDKITLDVCIVEVNGATVPETLPIEKELNEIYASSVVQWKVSRIKDFKVNIESMQNGIFDNTDPNNDMDYTDHEKQVKEALKDHKDYNRKTLYLFFIGGKTKDNLLKGYMPFNKQFGFIFRENQAIQELIRNMAHELGHGAFRLRHPFSPKCPYPQTKGQTNNLMDYVDAGKALQALALHKYQWDEVHDRDLGWNWFEDEGEGMLMEGLYWVNYEKENIIIHTDMTDENGNITYITPAGKPFLLPQTASITFSATIKNSETKEKVEVPFPRGALIGFIDNTGTYYANFTYKQNENRFIFNGYKLKSSDKLKEINQPARSFHKAIIGVENEYCRLEIISGDYNYTSSNQTNYKGEGTISNGDKYVLQNEHISKSVALPTAKCSPDIWFQTDPVTLKEFQNGIYSIYNYYKGDYGLLTLLPDKRFVYSKYTDADTYQFYLWNGKEWVEIEAPKPDCLSCDLSQILTIWSFVQLMKETGHEVLDFAGMMPVLGEPFDAINGVWYLVEGDKANACFSFASLVPIVGDASVKSVKYITKAGKQIELTATAYKTLKNIYTKLSKAETKILGSIFESSASLTSKYAQHTDKIERICVESTNLKTLNKLLKKIDDLNPELGIKFFDDLGSGDLLNNLAKFDEGLVESWKVLENSADLRKNIDALETIEYFTKHVNSNVDELTNSFKSAANKEDWFSAKIAEIRSKARSLPGTSKGNGAVIEGQWMRGTEGNLGLFPKQIADKLKGREFKNFAEFRNEFWKAVADDPDLAKQFSPGNQGAMKKGFAPTPSENQWLGERDTYEIHHKTPIHDGGEVYDMDNLVIVTPRYHKEVLDPAYHFNK